MTCAQKIGACAAAAAVFCACASPEKEEPPRATPLATEIFRIDALAVTATHVVWSENDFSVTPAHVRIRRMPKDGGAPEDVLEWPVSVSSLAPASDGLYFADFFGLHRLDPGGAVVPLASEADVRRLRVDGALLWATPSHIMTAALDGSGAIEIAGGQVVALGTFDHDAVDVYWVDQGSGEVRAAPRAGGAVRKIAAEPLGWGAVIAGAHVYWSAERADHTTVTRFAPKTGGAVEEIGGDAQPLGADGESVYGVTWDGTWRLDAGGWTLLGDHTAFSGVPDGIGTGTSYTPPRLLAIDASGVYVAGGENGHNWIARVPR